MKALVRLVGAAVACTALGVGAAETAAAPFDLSNLPTYEPGRQVVGTIRNFGFGMDGLLKLWEEDFRKFQPGITFVDRLPTSDAAIPALVTDTTDLAPDGGEPIITETLSFYETWGYHPTAITVASGAYDVEGHSNGPVVYVNKDNPISRLTLRQLDGIFGAQRTGGLDGFKWSLAGARGPADDIRTWGQLGLTGEWADKPIQTYGHAPSGTTRFFQLKVMHNSAKWNPNYREYVESGSKMVGDDDPMQRGGLQHMLRDELAHDKYGIAWTVMPQARDVAGLKPVALAAESSGPYVAPSRETFQSRDYPLVRSVYFYLNRPPGRAIDPKVKEFLQFILSRQGQVRLMKQGGYLPLTAVMVAAQQRQLDDPSGAALSGTIRTWGHGRRGGDVLGKLVNAWQTGFQSRYPHVDFETTLRGDDTAIGGMYTGAADIALMERPPLAIELDGYLPARGHPPQEVTVATGSLDGSEHAFAPVVFVHGANPLAHLTLAQLDAILGADRRRGGKPMRTWGDLGMGGAWKNAPINIYTLAIAQDVPQFIERAVMGGSQKWVARVREFDGGRQVIEALARDRYGIAISGVQYATAQVKPLALGATDGGPFVFATRDSVMTHQYPLTRSVSMFFDHAPGHPIDPKVAAYLSYVLSADGQDAIARDGGYLPLSPEVAAHELETLR